MDEINSPPTEKPTWRARAAALWDRLCEAFWYTGKGPAVVGLILVLLVVVAAAWLLLRTPDAPAAEKPAPIAEQAAPQSEPQPDPLGDLTERVIALEDETSRLAGLAHPPHGWTSASGQRPTQRPAQPTNPSAATSAAPAPLATPAPPTPITRQSVNQFRASLRTSQPDQE